MKKVSIISVILLVVGLLAGFFGGMKYEQSKISTSSNDADSRQFGQGTNFQNRNGQLQGRTSGSRPVAGEIIAKDESSITLKEQDGSSKIVFISNSTQINKASQASKDELKIGERVSVFGSVNSDGSVTAQNVQLNPISFGRGQPTQSIQPTQGIKSE